MNRFMQFLNGLWQVLQFIARIVWNVLQFLGRIIWNILTYLGRLITVPGEWQRFTMIVGRIFFAVLGAGFLVYIFTFPGGPGAAVENIFVILLTIGLAVLGLSLMWAAARRNFTGGGNRRRGGGH